MSGVDYDKNKFYSDSYGNLIPKGDDKRRFGSQIRCSLEASDCIFVKFTDESKKEAILRNAESDYEHWYLNDDFAGFVVEIDDQGYEFGYTE